MSDPASSLGPFLERLFERETGARLGAQEVAAGAERLYGKLSGQLEPLIGTDGLHALLTRAVHRTRSRFPLLGEIELGVQGNGSVQALLDVVRAADAADARETVVAVFGDLLALLAGFIGEDLAIRVVSHAWPQMPSPGAPVSAFDGEGQ